MLRPLLAATLLMATGCASTAPLDVATAVIPGQAPPPPASVMTAARPSLEEAGHYRIAFTAHAEHGCSRSFAFTQLSGEYALDLADDGRAELTLTSRANSTFGSRFSSEPTQSWTKDEAHVWKGEARRGKDGLEVKLSGEGKVALSCTFEKVDVTPAPRDPDRPEAAVPVEILRCKGAQAPLRDDDPIFVERLPLSRTAKLSLSTGSRWQPEEKLSLLEP